MYQFVDLQFSAEFTFSQADGRHWGRSFAWVVNR
jgi:hypothetical protein